MHFGSKWPSLNALKTFECVVRHLHMGQAAVELNVTDSAVSHQIRALEAELGFRLFRRGRSAMELTAEGERLAPLVRRGFELLAYAVKGVELGVMGVELTIACEPGMAAKCVAPRLGDFLAANPGLHVSLRPLWDRSPLSHKDVDAIISYGAIDCPGFHRELLTHPHFFPVMSPSLQRGPQPVRTPEDLLRHPLLYEETDADWRQWLVASGIDAGRIPRGVRLTHAHMTIDAAIAGYGVALGDSMLAAADLTSGRLVRPFKTTILAPKAYQLSTPDEPGSVGVTAFRTWLIDEIRRYSVQ